MASILSGSAAPTAANTITALSESKAGIRAANAPAAQPWQPLHMQALSRSASARQFHKNLGADAHATAVEASAVMSSDATVDEVPDPYVADLLAKAQAAHDAALAAAVEEAEQRGRVAGEIDGRNAANQRIDGAVAALSAVMLRVDAVQHDWTSAIEENIVTLAMAVARVICGQHLDASDANVQALVERAVAAAPPNGPLTVRVCPVDYAILTVPREPGNPASIATLAWAGRISWISDASLERGSVIVESPTRIVDGRIESALARVAAAIKDVSANCAPVHAVPDSVVNAANRPRA